MARRGMTHGAYRRGTQAHPDRPVPTRVMRRIAPLVPRSSQRAPADGARRRRRSPPATPPASRSTSRSPARRGRGRRAPAASRSTSRATRAARRRAGGRRPGRGAQRDGHAADLRGLALAADGPAHVLHGPRPRVRAPRRSRAHGDARRRHERRGRSRLRAVRPRRPSRPAEQVEAELRSVLPVPRAAWRSRAAPAARRQPPLRRPPRPQRAPVRRHRGAVRVRRMSHRSRADDCTALTSFRAHARTGTGSRTRLSPSTRRSRPSGTAAAGSRCTPRSCRTTEVTACGSGVKFASSEQPLAGARALEAEDVVVAGPERLARGLGVDGAGRAARRDQPPQPRPQPALDRRRV